MAKLLFELKNEGIDVAETEFAEDFEEYISQQHVILLPLVVGVGTKNKALTTLGMGVDLIGTKISLENVYGIKNINLANNPDEFIDKIEERLNVHSLFGLKSDELDKFVKYHSNNIWKTNFWDLINEENNSFKI